MDNMAIKMQLRLTLIVLLSLNLILVLPEAVAAVALAIFTGLLLLVGFVWNRFSAAREANDLLLKAVVEGDVDSAQRLLDAGADANLTDFGGWSLLCIVCSRHGSTENGLALAEPLLSHGADVNPAEACTCNLGACPCSPLVAALRNRDVALATLLISHGANVNFKTSFGSTPLSLAARFDLAETEEVVRSLLERGADPNEGVPSPLHQACHSYSPSPVVVKMLLDAGANPNAVDERNNTPVFTALAHSPDEQLTSMLEALAEGGADLSWRGAAGRTPLNYVCHLVSIGEPELQPIVDWLLVRGADPDVRDDRGQTALHVICVGWNLGDRDAAAVARLLLDHGADIEAARDEDCLPPFLLAVINDRPETAEALLQFMLENSLALDEDE